MSLHQSAPLVDSLNHVAHPVWAHSTLFSVAVQDSKLAPVDCAVLRTDRHVVRHVKDAIPPPDGQGMSAHPVPAMHSRGAEGLGQNAAVGPPYRPELGS